MDGISLIIRGDDFGLCHAVNQAMEEAFEGGLLTCASLLAVGPWVAEAASQIQAHPDWEIGLQLTLTCSTAGCRWGPLAGAAAVPSLVQATGTFFPVLPTSASEGDIERELSVQVERACSWGVKPAYLEYPGAISATVATALHHLGERRGVPTRMTAWGLRLLAAAPGDRAAVLAALGVLPPGVHLWVVHPAQDAPETWGLWDPQHANLRQADLLALNDPQVRGLIQRRGIKLIGCRQFRGSHQVLGPA